MNYYQFKETNPEFFDGVSLTKLSKLHDVIIVPPYREQTGRRILLYRMGNSINFYRGLVFTNAFLFPGNWDTSKTTVTELFQATLVVLELAILEQRAQILGGVAIFDLGGLTLNQALHMTPSVASRMVQIMVVRLLSIRTLHATTYPVKTALSDSFPDENQSDPYSIPILGVRHDLQYI